MWQCAYTGIQVTRPNVTVVRGIRNAKEQPPRAHINIVPERTQNYSETLQFKFNLKLLAFGNVKLPKCTVHLILRRRATPSYRRGGTWRSKKWLGSKMVLRDSGMDARCFVLSVTDWDFSRSISCPSFIPPNREQIPQIPVSFLWPSPGRLCPRTNGKW